MATIQPSPSHRAVPRPPRDTAARYVKRLALTLVALTAACASRPQQQPLPPPTLQPVRVPEHITVTAHVAPDSSGTPVVWIDFTNGSSEPVTLTHGACAFAAQLRAAGSANASWLSVPGGARPCIMIARILEVPAHERRSVPAGAIAASSGVDAPPRGRYEADALLNRDGRVQAVAAGSADIP